MKKKKANKEGSAETRPKTGVKSVYEELGNKDFKEMETKAILVMELSKTIKKQKLTQTAVAEVLGITQPKLSALLRGQFRGYSVERLIHFLVELGKDVDIVVKTKPRNRKGRVSVYPCNDKSEPNPPMAALGK
ncbi:MAG: helix-turn-helix domain protein [Parachlamydiales bacterium]|nr:helix-turn-helix domain protein [Parachlamydiales bacterium]